MSSYWDKKLKDLEQETKKKSSQSYWDKKEVELRNEELRRKAFIRQKEKEKEEEEDDIAPIKSTKDDGGLDFFQKSGLFDDGYDIGDITKTILGSIGDAGVNVVKGVGGLVEGVTDLASYGVAWGADAIGKDSFADDLREKTQTSYVDNLLRPAEDYLDKRSIFGRTSDSILQGVGQVGGIMATGGLGAAAGLGTAGVTALTTGVMGLSGMGSGMGEAYQGGATDEEATLYGAISGTADAISELIFGGLGKAVNAVGLSRGLSSADDMLAKKVSSMFSNQIMKNFSEFGIKAGAEGLEEVLAGIAQAAGKKATYMSEEEFSKILKDENLLEQFVVGAVTSGIAQAPGLHISNKTGSDFVTGMSQNEQAVVKKEVEKRIAEAEADGTKLTAKQKAAIEAQVEKDLEKGYISTDLIEEVVGGETYQTYKSYLDRETSLQQEFDTLNKMKQGDMTGEQIDRRVALKEQLAAIKDKPMSKQLRRLLDQEVSEQVKNDRLMESYNERTRRGQAFEADLTKYDAKQQAVIQKAVESGILNNTNRTHEFVDMVAKISADKGVLFDFTNNEKLKNSGFAVDGKAVNGYVTKDGVTINVQSAKSLNSIVGHEITHVLEGTDLYTELQTAVVEYAKTKGDYQGRFDSLSKLYEAVEGADINAEITADLVGDYLFTDPDFINNLSTNHRNVFQKIYDEVKYLLKVATAGSKEARELEKVKRAFEKAYRESSQVKSDNDSDTKYSLVTDEETLDFLDNQEQVKVYRAMQVIDGELYPPMAARVKDDSGKKQLVEPTKENAWYQADERPELMKFEVKQGKKKRFLTAAEMEQNADVLYGNPSPDDVITLRDGSTVTFGELNLKFELDKANGSTVPAAYNPYFHTSLAALNDQFSSAYNRPNLVVVEGYIPKSELTSGYKALYAKDSVGETTWHSGPVASALKGEKARKVFLSRWFKVGRIVSDTEAAGEIAKVLDGENLSVPWNVVTPSLRKALEAKGVSIDYKDVKLGSNTVTFASTQSDTKYSLSAEQQEFFKDSVVRDENGNLKVMYHGTSAGGHTMFDPYGKARYGLFGAGSYFTDSKDVAEGYTKKGKGKNPQVYETYLNIKNPMDMDAAADPAAWAKAFPDASFPESGTNEQFYRAMEEYFEDEQYARWEAAEEAMMAIEDMGFDGITHIGGGRFNKADDTRHRVYIAFQPEQIKNVDNRKPTSDPDIRYSLSEDSDGNKLTEEQAEYFKKSKMRDDAGNLKPMYHGTISGGFHVFDPGYSDDGTSFFFVDNNGVAASYSGTYETYEAKAFKTPEDYKKFFEKIGKSEYFVDEKDGKYRLRIDEISAYETVAESESIADLYQEFCDYEGVGFGDVNYKVYLNLENPLEVDADGREWDALPAVNEGTEQYEYIKIVEVGSDRGNVTIEYAMTGDAAPVTETVDLYEKFPYGLADTLANMAPGESLEGAYANPSTTRDYAKYAKENGYDGVIFKNIYDIGGYGGASHKSTVAIAFDSNQIKSVANEKPTSAADIRYSLSEDSQGHKLSEEQEEFFKDSVIRDENGSLMPMYHGTMNGGFTVFGGRKDHWYFTNDKKYAYTFEGRKANGQLYPDTKEGIEKGYYNPERYTVYLNVTNPFITDDVDVVEDALYWDKSLAGKLREKGYDALMLKDMSQVIVLNPNQIKNITNKRPTSDPDIRYSLSEDNEGRQLSPATAKRFSNSKAVDENGKLLVLYHGTASGEFSIFDKSKGSVEGDFGSGFYFTNDDYDVEENYEDGGPDFDNKVARLAEQIEQEEEIDYDEAEERARAELYKGGHRFEVYLNIENPAVVGKTILFDEEFGDRYNEEDFDDYDEYIAETEQAVADSIENIVWEVDRNVDVYSTDGLSDILFEAFYEGGIGIEELKKKINELYLEDSNGNLVGNEVTRQIIESLGYDGIIDPTVSQKFNMSLDDWTTHYIVFKPNQIKAVTNQNPTDNPDIHRSLSADGKKPRVYGSYNVYGKDIALDIAPVAENATTETSNATPNATLPTSNATLNSTEQAVTQLPEENSTVAKNAPVAEESSVAEMFPDDLAPVPQELEYLQAEAADIQGAMEAMAAVGDVEGVNRLIPELESVQAKISALQAEDAERVATLDDADMPPEVDAPYPGEQSEVSDPFENHDIVDVGNRSVKAYQYENPEVKPFFREAALGMLGDLHEGTKGEKIFNGDVYYQSGGEAGWMGTKRHTTDDIAELLDTWHYTYDQIEKGLNAIIEDDGKENNAVSKRIEFMLNDRLMNGWTGVWGEPMPPNQDYINLLEEKQITEYSREAFASLFAQGDQYAPPVVEDDDIAPVANKTAAERVYMPTLTPKEGYEAITPKKQSKKSKKSKNKLVRADKATTEQEKIAQILDSEPAPETRKSRAWARFKANVLDKGAVFEDLSLKTRNRELMGKWNYIISSEARAQRLMGNGNSEANIKSLKAIREEVENTGKAKQFYEYLYHRHNVDRMQLAERYEDTPNKPVFGYSVTAEVSQGIAEQMERENPSFARYAQDVYDYMNHLRSLLVDNGVISQETAELWSEMYPHYVPIRRAGDTGLNINVPLDTGRTGVNAPVKRATGGNSDILPLFDTMGQRTIQTFKAIAKNSFGVELKNALGTTIENTETSVDEVIDSIDTQEGLLQKGKNGSKPTFTVFENGEKVTFSITEDMYDALKPVSEGMAYTNKVANTISNFHRGLLTEYNPVFMLTNAIKDSQDILINSQHPARTYAKIPEAYWQQFKKGYWYQEYMANGGEQNTYFDNESNTFDTEHKGFTKLLDAPPLSIISKLNNLIEMTPRLAEYIASREAGRSVEVSMLDAARVTTNFSAGGDLTKFLNRNGATFLNASVQGVMQNVRNFREAKAAGWKGWANLATKFAVAGLPAVLLNNLVWDDDDEYEELSDYVKQNYYIVGKYGDGKFIRIPKGRTLAVIQSAIEQIGNAVTGNDEVDLGSFLELVVSNLAPNNPVEDNILAPIIQVANNETWYGEDLVPTRLQNLPAAEQFDESTDKFSKWLGEKLGVSPVKINYLLDQYSGGLGDTVLPMLTPEAESGDNSVIGNVLAPLKSKFTADSVMNNQNVSDFYDTKDELTVKANASTASDEDVLMSKYINSVNTELSELYAKKREIQNSDLPDDEKYAQVRDVQQQIVDLTRKALKTYESVAISGEYAEVGGRYFNEGEEGDWRKLTDEQAKKYEVTSAAGGDSYATDGTVHYRWYVKEGETEGEWRKITAEQLEKQKEVTSGLGISPSEYWSNKEEYDYAYEHPENYAVAKAVGGYESYKSYSSELYDIKADKDASGKSISGSRKEKVLDYINSLDIDYGERLILFKNEYNADDTYNYEIIDYLNSRSDISPDEELAILRKLGFTVTADGTIYWD